MGDECHNRYAAASLILFKKLAPVLLKTDLPQSDIVKALEFIAGNHRFFLNISMACCKAMLDAGHDVEHSTLVTAMARNGVDFGIQVSGSGDAWSTAPAPMVYGLFFPGYSQADAAPDLGHSAITETAGIGGFAMGAAPAIVQFVGGTPQDAIAYTREKYHITMGVNGGFTHSSTNTVPSGRETIRAPRLSASSTPRYHWATGRVVPTPTNREWRSGRRRVWKRTGLSRTPPRMAGASRLPPPPRRSGPRRLD